MHEEPANAGLALQRHILPTNKNTKACYNGEAQMSCWHGKWVGAENAMFLQSVFTSVLFSFIQVGVFFFLVRKYILRVLI